MSLLPLPVDSAERAAILASLKYNPEWNDYVDNRIPRDNSVSTQKIWQRFIGATAALKVFTTPRNSTDSRDHLTNMYYEYFAHVIWEKFRECMHHAITLDILLEPFKAGTVWKTIWEPLSTAIKNEYCHVWFNEILTKKNNVPILRSGQNYNTALLELRRRLWLMRKREPAEKRASEMPESAAAVDGPALVVVEDGDVAMSQKKSISKKTVTIPEWEDDREKWFPVEWLVWIMYGHVSPHAIDIWLNLQGGTPGSGDSAANIVGGNKGQGRQHQRAEGRNRKRKIIASFDERTKAQKAAYIDANTPVGGATAGIRDAEEYSDNDDVDDDGDTLGTASSTASLGGLLSSLQEANKALNTANNLQKQQMEFNKLKADYEMADSPEEKAACKAAAMKAWQASQQ